MMYKETQEVIEEGLWENSNEVSTVNGKKSEDLRTEDIEDVRNIDETLKAQEKLSKPMISDDELNMKDLDNATADFKQGFDRSETLHVKDNFNDECTDNYKWKC